MDTFYIYATPLALSDVKSPEFLGLVFLKMQKRPTEALCIFMEKQTQKRGLETKHRK